MISLQERIVAFSQLGKTLKHFAVDSQWENYQSGLTKEEFNHFNQVIKSVNRHNGWFTENNVRLAIEAISEMLSLNKLTEWVANYQMKAQPKTVAIIMAGNIPLVGFHDFLSVLISGHSVMIKMSSNDKLLFPELVKILIKIEPRFEERIIFSEKLQDFDAVIATGSDNSAVYFESYFGKYPNIIRKNRTSIAILEGSETEEELKELSKDVFQYFGLGCRNITKVYLPQDYDLNHLFKAFYDWKEIINHNKYANNYDYNKAIYLLNKVDLIENGFLLLKEDEGLHSPLGALFYERYQNMEDLNKLIENKKEELQCIVSKKHIPFGKAQSPELWDYADGVDTLAFLDTL